ncbi:MAG: TolC family protein, partial [Acidobacteria bacterium]|nr:TolC family protein [Acidobacteriota bacterium]
SSASSMPDPILSFTYMAESIQTRVGPQEYKIGISQKFPWFGKLSLQQDIADAGAEAAFQSLLLEVLKTSLELKKAYYDYYYLSKETEITEYTIKLIKSMEAVARTKYETGQMPYSDLLRIQMELEKLRLSKINLDDQRIALSARLQTLIGSDLNEILPFPQELAGLTEVKSSYENGVSSDHPALVIFDDKQRAESYTADLASRNNYPDIVLGSEWTSIGESVTPDMPGSGTDAVGIMLSVNIPFFSGKNNAEEASARAKSTMQSLSRREKQTVMTAELAKTAADLKDYRRKVTEYKDYFLPIIEQITNQSLTDFRNGALSMIDLLKTEREYIQTRLEYEKINIGLHKTAALSDYLSGHDISLKKYRDFIKKRDDKR